MKKIANVKHDNLDEESVLKNNVSKLQQHTLICGYGRVGQTVSRLLAQENKPYVVIDGDPMHVQEASRAGEPVFFGDCLRIEMLESMGLSKARQVVLCIDNVQSALQIVKNIRLKVLSLPIVVRTKHYEDAELLKYAGATVVVPEMLECSLTVAKHVLFMLGLSAETVKNRIQNARKQRYEILNSYYPGINDFLSDSENKEHRYAVEINEHSSLLGKRIDHFEAEDAGKITVVELVRDGVRSYPDKSTVLQLNDKIIISGSGSYIAKIEREL